ncbi:MAG: transposase [Dehalococcoidia bacterium]
MRTYSLDLRQKIVDAHDHKQGSQRQLARNFGVSRSFVEKLFRQRRQRGSLEPKPHGGGQKPLLGAEDLELVRHLVRRQPDLTLQELCDLVYQQGGVRVSVPTMCTWLQRLGLGEKKSRCTPASETPTGCSGCVASTDNGWAGPSCSG